jgi:hypothetical protein
MDQSPHTVYVVQGRDDEGNARTTLCFDQASADETASALINPSIKQFAADFRDRDGQGASRSWP